MTTHTQIIIELPTYMIPFLERAAESNPYYGSQPKAVDMFIQESLTRDLRRTCGEEFSNAREEYFQDNERTKQQLDQRHAKRLADAQGG